MKKKILFLVFVLIIIGLIVVAVIFKNQDPNEENENITKVNLFKNNFNINLIKLASEDKQENYLISPYSIEIALSMLRDGANGDTFNEIYDVIGKRDIKDVTIDNRVSVANAAFVKNIYKNNIKDSYYNLLKNKYDSEILYDEFETPKVINDWVNEKTNGMIENVLDNIDEEFVLGLANALAIDVEWNSQFDCNDTDSQEFTMIDGKKMKVEMMHDSYKHFSYKYLENDNAKGIIIPYKKYDKTGKEDYENGNNLEFIAILPNGDVDEYISNITNDELNDLFSHAKEANSDYEIRLSLPRFKYDYTLLEFKNILNNLAFNDKLADFSNIIDKNDKINNLYVNQAIHKTHIDLNEKGTKAAAVTYFGMSYSAMMEQPEYVNIIFDKPFIYIIKDSKTNEMLFFGAVYEPNEWKGSTCSEIIND